jgi:hypothetical protein
MRHHPISASASARGFDPSHHPARPRPVDSGLPIKPNRHMFGRQEGLLVNASLMHGRGSLGIFERAISVASPFACLKLEQCESGLASPEWRRGAWG